MPTIEQVVATYIKWRDQKKKIQDRHKEELADVKDKMYKMEQWLHKQLNSQGADHIGTPAGTAYLSTTISAKVEERDEFFRFVSENDLWAMLESRANKTAVEEYLESTGELPPGLSVSRETNVRIRR